MSQLTLPLYENYYQADQDPNSGEYMTAYTYNWNNSSDATHYQSANVTGSAVIDQTIARFQLNDDAFSLGAHVTQLFTRNAQGQEISAGNFIIKTDRNHIRKNQAIFCPYGWGGGFEYSEYGSYMINRGQYFPLSPPANVSPFMTNFFYNKLLVVPIWFIVYTDNNTISRWVNITSVDRTRPFFVKGVQLRIMYTGNMSGNPSFYVQFSGTLYDNDPHDGYETSRPQVCSPTNGTFYIPFGTSYNLFNIPVLKDGGVHISTGEGYHFSQTFFLDLSQELTHQAWVGSELYTGVSFETACLCLDRLGLNWSLLSEADSASILSQGKLGAHCEDAGIRCAIIDPETFKVTTTVLEGSDIAEYAYDHSDDPNLNYNWDYGSANRDGKSIFDIASEYDSHLPTVEPADEIDLNEPVSATSGGNTVWIMSEEKVKEFFMWLWNPDGTIFDDIVKALALLGENPMDSVVTLKLFPFDISLSSITYSYADICFGRKRSPVNAPHLTSSNVVVFDLGSFIFNDVGMQNDFRDYEPYSDYSLYIPFVGIIQLQAIECINTTISVKMIVDLITGSATAVVFTNGVPYKYLDGQIGIDMPVTGRNMADYGKTILAGALAGAATGGKVAGKSGLTQLGRDISQRGEKIQETAVENASFLGSDATGRWGNQAAKGAAMQVAGASFGTLAVVAGAAIGGGLTALMNAPQPESAGSNSPATGLAKPLYPYFIVRRSDCWIPENYNHLYGRPLNEGGVVGDFTGFSVFTNVKVENIDGATPEEVKLIIDLLQSGVYI